MSNKLSYRLALVITLLMGLALPSYAGLAVHVFAARPPTANRYLYRDCQLEGLWESWSYYTKTLDFCSKTERYTGDYSIQVELGPWGGLSLYHKDFDSDAWQAVSFYIHGGTAGGQQLKLGLHGAGGQDKSAMPSVSINNPDYIDGGAVSAGSWKNVTVPLAALSGEDTIISRVTILNATDNEIPSFYIDDLHLVARELDPFDIHVDAHDIQGKISSEVFGTNAAMWMPDGNGNQDLMSKVQASGITLLRFPGGSEAERYHWREHEPVDDNSETTNTSEFIQFTRVVDAEPMFTVNFDTGTAEEAADWVRYANTWGVKYWEVGNEINLITTTITATDTITRKYTPQEYVLGKMGRDGFNDYCWEMKAVDPTIQVGAVGTNHPDADNRWGPEMLKVISDCVDFYVIHDYAFPPTMTVDGFDLLGSPTDRWPEIGANLREMFITYAPELDLDVGVTEYNSTWGPPPTYTVQVYNMLFLADTLGQIIEQGFEYANHWAILDRGANSRLGYLLEDLGLYRQPSYYAFPLWAHAGSQRLGSRVNRHAGFEMSVYATREQGSGDVILTIINKTEATSGTIAIENFRPSGIIEAYVAQGNSLDDPSVTYNGLEDPPIDLEAVAPFTQTIASSVFSYTLPAYSVTSLRIKAMQSVYLPLVMAEARSP